MYNIMIWVHHATICNNMAHYANINKSWIMNNRTLVPVFPNPAFHINSDDFSCRPAAGRQYSDSLTPKDNQHKDLVAKKESK